MCFDSPNARDTFLLLDDADGLEYLSESELLDVLTTLRSLKQLPPGSRLVVTCETGAV
jgi:hypothetical protein